MLSAFCFLLSGAAQAASSGAPPQQPAGRVEVRGEWLYVDGEPFLVKGIGYSPQDGVDVAVMERDFQRIAAAGFNTLRTWSPLPPEALALADRHGLMVLQGVAERRDAEQARGHSNVLAVLVGKEPTPDVEMACFTLPPDEPAAVSYVFGFRSYVEHLRRTVARRRPLIIMAVGAGRWDELFQAGAAGGVVSGWSDELAKALADYNQAVLLSPVSGERYQQRIPVTVYAAELVAQVRVRLDGRKWLPATKLNRHWWKVMVPLDAKEHSGEHALEMEALDAKNGVILQRERTVLVGPPLPAVRLSIAADRPSYDVGETPEPARYTFTVTDESGTPLPNRPVLWSIAEPQSDTDLTQTTPTDAAGRVEGTHLIRQPGSLLLSAATPLDPAAPERRIGAEQLLVVRRLSVLRHQPSSWEAGLPAEVTAELRRHERPAFQLADPGLERIIDYERYGTFQRLGTAAYRYEVADWAGLAAAAGEGVYPNEGGLMRDPAYQAAQQGGRLSGSHWDFTFHDDPQLAFFKWASAEEEVGVKQFFTAQTLEQAGLLLQAVKAYHAVLVHFPTSVGWTAFDPPTPWYVARGARDKIEAILRLHPELGMRLEDTAIIIQNGFDNDVENDVIAVHPGRLVPAAPEAVNPPTLAPPEGAARTVGHGRVRLARDARGHWRLLVDGEPFVVRGMTYSPSAVGESPDVAPLLDWSAADRNANGVLDVLETFVDANRNDAQDSDEPAVGDFQMLHELGVNTLRLYHTNHSSPKALKQVLRQLHERYGFLVIMGDFVGMYTVGSGAKWEEGTDYLDKRQRKRMFEGVKRMVREFKDEPYLLMWVLGNENNYGGVHGIVGGVGNAGKYPAEYYRFINELATWIHKADPNHPVAVGNGDILFLNLIAKHAPAIDVFGANAYRGAQGFGRSFFEEVRRWLDKPVLITEFGCPAYQAGRPPEVAEASQALYHLGSWVDLADNMAGRGVGDVLGGIVFEWSDEWWKAGQPPRFSPTVQETRPNWAGPFPGGWNFEEWFGIVSQGDGTMSPFLRQLRTSYRLYQELWKRY